MPRFVILRHEPAPDTAQRLHWDLMLEAEPLLRTWALSQEPSSGVPVSAMRLDDHRKLYLDYEGPVPGNRGRVHRWDQGLYEMLSEDDLQISVRLSGQTISGIATLSRGADPKSWTVVIHTPHAPR